MSLTINKINFSISLCIKFKFYKKANTNRPPLEKRRKAKSCHQTNHQLNYKVISKCSAENATTTVLIPGQFCSRTTRNTTHQGCQHTPLVAQVHLGLIWPTAGKPSAWSLLPLVPRCTPVCRDKFTNTKCRTVRAPLKCQQSCFESPELNGEHRKPDLHAACPACSTPEQS